MFTGPPSGEYPINLDRQRMGPIEMEESTGKWRCGNTESAPSCPRCASSNTKFCYYNNYSLSQPRYFCKGCRRYWTKGGSLRNVPIGGGCRKSRRSRASRHGSAGAASPRLTQGRSGGADIDLAAVFAKYVGENEESSSTGGSSGSSDNIPAGSAAESDGQLDDIAMFPYQNQKLPVDLINGGDDRDQLQQVPEFPIHGDAINGQDFVCSGFDQLQPGVMLGDELGVFWSDGTNLPDFECQEMHDFGNFGVTENNNYNLSYDNNWEFFDFPSYEHFSRP